MAELDGKEAQGLRLQLNTRSHLFPNRLHKYRIRHTSVQVTLQYPPCINMASVIKW